MGGIASGSLRRLIACEWKPRSEDGFQMTNLDAKTGAILRALLRDARQSMRSLGAAVGLSPPAATERVRRLEDLGVIRGYKPLIDAARIGWPVQAIASITARDGRC